MSADFGGHFRESKNPQDIYLRVFKQRIQFGEKIH